MQEGRIASNQPSPIDDETARLFHVALHDVLRSSAISMADLRECVIACVRDLRTSSVGPAEMIISMKACIREGKRRYPLSEDEISNGDFLVDHIIKWSIIEYYNS